MASGVAPGKTVQEGLDKKHEWIEEACGPIRTRCRRGSGGSNKESDNAP